MNGFWITFLRRRIGKKEKNDEYDGRGKDGKGMARRDAHGTPGGLFAEPSDAGVAQGLYAYEYGLNSTNLTFYFDV